MNALQHGATFQILGRNCHFVISLKTIFLKTNMHIYKIMVNKQDQYIKQRNSNETQGSIMTCWKRGYLPNERSYLPIYHAPLKFINYMESLLKTKDLGQHA